jgi:hypothetical protein
MQYMYPLVDQEVYTDMLLWALDRAATGLWRVPSQNISNRTTTRDVAMCILALNLKAATHDQLRSFRLARMPPAAGRKEWWELISPTRDGKR